MQLIKQLPKSIDDVKDNEWIEDVVRKYLTKQICSSRRTRRTGNVHNLVAI